MAKATAAAKTPAADGGSNMPAVANDNGGAALAPTANDELAGLDFGADFNDGLGEIDREDIKIPVYVINMKGTGPDGRAIPKDVYYNTVDEKYASEVDAVFCLLHKSNLYSVFNEAEDRTDIVCKSYDRTQGVMADGTIRACQGCPDAQWRTETDQKTGKQKRVRNCSTVYNVFSFDRATEQPFLVRFKKTGLGPFKSYLQKHHIGRRVVNGQRLNYPLFAFHCKLTAQMANAKANYAVPVLERAGILSREEITRYAEATRALTDQARTVLERAEQAEAQREGAVDTSFDTDKFAGDAGKDFSE